MIVCIAEKPSVARDIANILGATQSHDGYLEGNGYQVTWTFGHLCELKYPEDYSPQWRTWSLASLPIIPSPFGIRLKKDKGVEKQFRTIEKLMKNADRIINCGDAGQEGELIQRWVMQMVGVKCPVSRLWISSLTEESIKQGFQQLKDQSEYQSLYEAGLCRAIGDWLLGMNASRLYTLKYGTQRVGAPPLSVGRVQTPTLAMIVKRCREIRDFVPQPYWVLATMYRDTIFTATSGKFDTEEDGQAALARITGKEFQVTEISKKKGHEAAPRLLDLTTLQVECNRKFGYSADTTLKLIQGLYEKKYTTYPRVDTTYLSDDIYPKVPNTLAGIKDYYPQIAPLLGLKADGKKGAGSLPKSKKVFDTKKVTAHHAIIPTGQRPEALTADEKKVYDLVALHFIAVFYPDCEVSNTTVMAKAGEIDFKVTGREVLKPGWRAVFDKGQGDNVPSTKDSSDDENAENAEETKSLPAFVKGESGAHEPVLKEKTTTPPKYYTEATLLRAMETAGKTVDNDELREAMKENGIGRPSTRAAIIEKLYQRKYIQKQGKSIRATETGINLIHLIISPLLKSAELTGLWEKKLREIERGEYKALDFLNELKEMTSGVVRDVKSNKAGMLCPVCRQGLIIRGNTRYGCSRWKEGCNYAEPF